MTQPSDLLISQWQSRRAPRFFSLVNGMWNAIDQRVNQPLQRLDEMRSIDTAVGIWLDYAGERLGVARPSTNVAGVPKFGFDTDPDSDLNVGFDQAPFESVRLTYSAQQPVGDVFYRTILKLQGGYLFSDSSVVDLNAVLQNALPGAVYRDHHNMTATVYMNGMDSDLLMAIEDAGVLYAPAGVQLTVNNWPAPTGLAAVPASDQVDLTWNDPDISDIIGYQYRQDYGTWVAIPLSDKDTVTYTVTGLTSETEYRFDIRIAVAGLIYGLESGLVVTTTA